MGVTSLYSFHGLPKCQGHDPFFFNPFSYYLYLVDSILNSAVHSYSSVWIFLFIKTSHHTQPLNYSWSKPEDKKSFTFIDFLTFLLERVNINKLRKWPVQLPTSWKTGAELHLNYHLILKWTVNILLLNKIPILQLSPGVLYISSFDIY